MTDIDVDYGRMMHAADPAATWTLVADPERIIEWAPVHAVGFMGTELPSVGHTAFVTMRAGRPPDEALRFRVVEWDAGHRYRCEVEGFRWATKGQFVVTVDSELEEGHAAASVKLGFRAVVPRWLAPLYRLRVRSLLRRGVAAIERLTTPQ
jgi:hypothetical protein